MQPNPFPGKLITFEGIDGSGKSEQLVRTRNYLNASGLKPIFTKEPTDQPSGQIIYQILKNQHPHLKLTHMHPYDFQKLYFCDRVWHYKDKIIPSISGGLHVISDRGPVSCVFGAKSKNDFQALIELEKDIFKELGAVFYWPDANLIFDVPVDVAMERLLNKNKELDQFETEKKLTEVRQNYLDFAQIYPNCHVIDATGGEQNVFVQTRAILNQILQLPEWK